MAGSIAAFARAGKLYLAGIAGSSHRDLDLASPESGRQRDRWHPRLVETDHPPAITALEVRVRTAFALSRRREPPDAILAGDLVGESLGGEPFEHAVERDAVDVVATRETPLDIVMRQRFMCREQDREDIDTRSRDPRATVREQRMSARYIRTRARRTVRYGCGHAPNDTRWGARVRAAGDDATARSRGRLLRRRM